MTLISVSRTVGHFVGSNVFSSVRSMLPDMSTRKTTFLPVRAMPAKRCSDSISSLLILSASLALVPCRSTIVTFESATCFSSSRLRPHLRQIDRLGAEVVDLLGGVLELRFEIDDAIVPVENLLRRIGPEIFPFRAAGFSSRRRTFCDVGDFFELGGIRLFLANSSAVRSLRWSDSASNFAWASIFLRGQQQIGFASRRWRLAQRQDFWPTYRVRCAPAPGCGLFRRVRSPPELASWPFRQVFLVVKASLPSDR